jgi:hypothetical protein
MTTLINGFVRGGLNIANSRMDTKLSEGGLGMINVKLYITGIQAAWFKKINGQCIDNWRGDIFRLTNGNIFAIDPVELTNLGSGLVAGIAESYCKISAAHIRKDNNILESFMANNPLLNRLETNGTVLQILRNNVPRISDDVIFELKVKDFWQGGIKTLDQICTSTGQNISLVTYMRLNRILSLGCGRIERGPDPVPVPVTITKLFAGKTKGSKKIRKVLEDDNVRPIQTLRQVTTFFRLIEIPVPENKALNKIYGGWGLNFFPNKTRDFVFKFYNNILGLNTRIAHFADNQTRNCGLCSRAVGGPVPVPDQAPDPDLVPAPETFSHLFYQCPMTTNLRTQLTNNCMQSVIDFNEIEKKMFWFSGYLDRNTEYFLGTFALVTYINEYIWECKLKKVRMSLPSLLNELDIAMPLALKASRKMLRCCKKISLPIFRRWCQWEPGGDGEDEDEEDE